ncbi:MAG TPA: serine/threonine-protein kinase, partial [Polyangiaceae bacterium]|nr:serine/threonine-protein kinase [Polyangiaceae bacterium]
MKDQGPLGAGHGGPPDDSNEEASPPGSGSAQITLPSITPRPAVDADTVVRGPARQVSTQATELASAPWVVDEAPPSASAFLGAPRRGDLIGQNQRFEIVEKLGEGGMGHVFRAIDSHLDRTVAVKFILHTQQLPLDQLISQLEREARVTARLNHENIVAIFDMGAYNGVPFLVMELLDGQSLDVLMETSRISVLRATAIMQQVARGLSHAHKNGIVHRDLKPSNVFILRDGRAKILDFGISRFEQPLPASLPNDLNPTMFGAGTPAYMAPERWRDGHQDGRTDIWAAGVMFFQMLSGKLPYTVPELLSFAVRGRAVAPSVRSLVPTLPEEADRLVATALNHEPEGRFQTAAELEV